MGSGWAFLGRSPDDGDPAKRAGAGSSGLGVIEWCFRAGLIGVVHVLLAGTALMRLGLFGRPSLVAVFVAFGTAGWLVHGRVVTRPSKGDLLALGGIVLVALALRTPAVHFIFQIGDMGAYVNNANMIAGGSRLVESFPHGFSVLLAVPSALFGPAYTVSVIPAVGVLTVLGLVELARLLGLPRWAVAVVALLGIFHPMAVWFGQFPVSETPYGLMAVGLLVFAFDAASRASRASAASVGLLAGLMMHVRGTAILVVILVFLVGVGWALRAPGEEQARSAGWMAMVAVVTGAAAWIYNVKFLPVYFVDTQIESFLPGRMFQVLERLGLLQMGPRLLVVTVLGFVAVAGTLALSNRIARRVSQGPERSRLDNALWMTAVGALAVGVLDAYSAGLRNAVPRWGVVAPLSLLGLAAVMIDREVQRRAPRIWWLLLFGLGSMSLMVFGHRIPEARNHAFLYYWDRYLYQDSFLIAILLGGLGAYALWRWLRMTSLRGLRYGLGGLVVALLLMAVSWSGLQTIRISEDTMFGDAYGILADLDAATGGPEGGPIVYAGEAEIPENWIFHNSFRAFALPLVQSFDRLVLGLPPEPFVPDPVTSPMEAAEALEQFGTGTVVAVGESNRQAFGASPCFAGGDVIEAEVPVIKRSAQWRRISEYAPTHFQFSVFRFEPGAGCFLGGR